MSGTGAFDPGVNWSVISGGGTLSANSGSSVTYTAPTVTGDTSVQIKAEAAGNYSIFKTLQLTVKASAPTPPPIPTPDLPTQTDFAQPSAIVGQVQDVGPIGPNASLVSTNFEPTRSANLKADGSFSLPLGANDTLSSAAQPVFGRVQLGVDSLTNTGGCSGQIVFSNLGLQGYFLDTLLYRPTSNPSGTNPSLSSITIEGSVGEIKRVSMVQNVWLFAPSRGSARGTVVCAGGYVQANLQFKAGWNALALYVDAGGTYNGIRYLSADPKPATFGLAQFPM